jgi:hypothetical protein
VRGLQRGGAGGQGGTHARGQGRPSFPNLAGARVAAPWPPLPAARRNFYGTDTFDYAVNDGVDTLNATATVTLIISPPLPLVPPPQGDYNWTMSSTALTFKPPSLLNILTNVSTPNPGGNLTVLKVTQQPPDGTVTLDGDTGDFVFTLKDPKWSGGCWGCCMPLPAWLPHPSTTCPRLVPSLRPCALRHPPLPCAAVDPRSLPPPPPRAPTRCQAPRASAST